MNKQRKAIRSLLAFSALFLSTHAFAETATLTVTISDLKTNQGSVLIAGYQDEKSFQSFSNWAFSAEQAVDSQTDDPANPMATATTAPIWGHPLLKPHPS